MILAILHQEDSTPGRIGELLIERGYTLDRRCPCIGQPLPSSLDDYHASIIFGGPQSANDDCDAGIRQELDWLESVALPSARPLLGICLGAQQLAKVLGARVGPHPAGWVEIGYHEVAPTEQGRAFLDAPTMFYQWHGETFDIPASAVHLAASDRFPAQAFVYQGNAFAIEFHPEMTLGMINRWCTSESGSKKLGLDGATPHAAHVDGFMRHAAQTDRWLNRFLDRLLQRDVEHAPPGAVSSRHAVRSGSPGMRRARDR